MTRKFLYRPLRFLPLALAGLFLLTACGGGNEDITGPSITLETSIKTPTNTNYTSSSPLPVEATVDSSATSVTVSATPSSILGTDTVLTPPNISFSLSDLVEGTNTVKISAEDAKGNVNTLVFSIVLDTNPPILLLGPVSTVTPDTSQTIGAVSEAGLASSSVTPPLPATSTQISPPVDTMYTLEYQLDNLQNGDNPTTMTATDAAGNVNTKTFDITVDPDVAPVTIDPHKPSVTSQSVTLTGTDPSDAALNVTAEDQVTNTPVTVSGLQESAGVWQATVSGLVKGNDTKVTVTAGSADAAGNIGTAVVDLIYNTAPKVKSTVPTANATDVSVNTPIKATFDQPVINVDGTSFKVVDSSGNHVQGAVSGTGTSTVTFTPSSPLVNNQSYTVTLTDKITNTAGTKLAQKVWSFTTTQ